MNIRYGTAARFLVGIFWLMVAVLSVFAVVAYQGQWWIYLLFTLVANLLLYFGFRRRAIFFDTFIGALLWLGFWLKSSVRIAFMDGEFLQPTGAFDGSPALFDQGLLVSACGLLGLLAASLIRERFFSYPDRVDRVFCYGLFGFYQRYRSYILAGFCLLVVTVALSNAWFGIYQRGEIPKTVLPFGMSGIFTWLLLFGLASASSLFLYFEFLMNRCTTYLVVLVAMLETFMSSVSMLSRGMILNGGALFWGGYRSLKIYTVSSTLKFLSVAVVVFALLFITSVFAVNHMRAASTSSMNGAHNGVHSIIEHNSTNKLADLVLDRWVGIEGVLAVVSYPKLGRDLWDTAWHEQLVMQQSSFFDRNLIDSPYQNMDTSRHHYVSLPGLVAFFFYPGSFLVLFFCTLLAGIFAAFVEFSAYRLGGRNVILCALIAQVVAYRYMSFGYVPARSYMLFGTIYLDLFLIFMAERLMRLIYPSDSMAEIPEGAETGASGGRA